MDSSNINDPKGKRKIILWESHGGPNQQWMFYPGQNRTYFMVNCSDQGALQVPNKEQIKPMTEMYTSKFNRTPNEQWLVTPHGEGVMIRSALKDSIGLNICGGTLNNGANIILYELSGTAN